ncbi:MAG: type III PLP-dependent enzyme [Brevinematia bacterium]
MEIEEVPPPSFGVVKYKLFPEKVFTKLKPKIDNLIASLNPSTPILVIDSGIVRKRYYELVNNFPGFKVYYAVKANDNVKLLEVLANFGANFEVASVDEVVKLVELGVSGNRMISSNPIKPINFIEVCRHYGINYLCVDSKEEIDKIKYAFPNANIYLRLEIDNPESSWPLSGKFGLNIGEVEDIIAYSKRKKVNLVGVTFHAGSQNNSVRSIEYALEVIKEVFKIGKKYKFSMHLLNIGGGFPIDYTEKSRSISDFRDSIFSKLAEFVDSKKLILQMEPGRRIVGEAGIMVSRVIGKAFRNGENWIYLDVGVFNGLMEVIGGINYLFKTNSRRKTKLFNIGGPSCDSMDVIAKNVELPEPDIGDYVYILSAGAYTTVYAAKFNGYSIPEVIVL